MRGDGGAAQHRQHRVGDPDDADDVGVDDGEEQLGADPGGLLRRPAGDAGVVDEHVEPALRLELGGRGGDAGVVGHVERDAEHVEPLGAELGHRLLAPAGVAGAEADAEPEAGEARGDLVADALVGAGDQRGPRLGLVVLVVWVLFSVVFGMPRSCSPRAGRVQDRSGRCSIPGRYRSRCGVASRDGDPRAALLPRRRRGVARRPRRRAPRDGPAAAVARDRRAGAAPRRRPVRAYAARGDAHRRGGDPAARGAGRARRGRGRRAAHPSYRRGRRPRARWSSPPRPARRAS